MSRRLISLPRRFSCWFLRAVSNYRESLSGRRGDGWRGRRGGAVHAANAILAGGHGWPRVSREPAAQATYRGRRGSRANTRSDGGISLSLDLKRLDVEGYEIEIRDGYLLLHSVPYVDEQARVLRGTLASSLTLAGDVAERPQDHTVHYGRRAPRRDRQANRHHRQRRAEPRGRPGLTAPVLPQAPRRLVATTTRR
jgi:hypothetical protein